MTTLYKTTKTATAIIIALGILSGCAASPQDKASNEESSKLTTDSQSANETSNKNVNNKKPDKEEHPAAGTETNNGTENAGSNKDTPTSDNKEAAVKKLYRINKVYRFEPISKETSNKVVLLTFDDGPKEDKMISGLLDTLDKHKAKAIFFVNGYRVKKHPELLKKIADRGQTIGNHSWDHIDLKKETAAVVQKQVDDVQTLVKETIGTAPLFFRPPFGSGGDTVKEIVKKDGMLFMTWSNGSLDWDKSTKNKPDLVIKNVLDQLHPGANILMHELPWTVEALDTLLTKLEQKGYGFIDPATIDVEPSQPKSAK
ncbi:hypothetical protein Back11_23730 [Paenibacillus baekrokdamisoli]|uniref:NodB homology domain-containing protein n=1 Tax=Paenibacillus baekrokdamisoli TaxID=1712516 RepID=A0A3G9JB07_9BACL|nr:polysaccharide deacetylase family protein [Paenibacillus baekrokdamisoli]MBB3069618.1 peptidoglycan/xylan/chitin deacetylase (PgdA/CDA1 family) [Paenibacillus baekrokdamisoli]BBH21028.1 hypothetical protein Back11_23730 [Paenibacillus baekrokdamisoli]